MVFKKRYYDTYSIFDFVVNGNWGEWVDLTTCSKNCGGGEKTRHRECNNPPPAHGGQNCPGPSQKTITCNTHACPGNKQFILNYLEM